ncbi:MAG: PKD domain-containing protein [Saprospiraceae bacterium]
MKKITLLILVLNVLWLKAQDVIIQSTAMPLNPEYSVKFNSFEAYDIDVEKVRNDFRSTTRSGVEVDLMLGGKLRRLQVFKYNMIRPDSKINVSTANGIVVYDHDPSIETYRGYNANFGGQEVAITFSKNFMSLMFKEADESYYLEQVPYEFNDPNPNHFILYNSKSYKVTEKVKCLAEDKVDMEKKHEPIRDENASRNQGCYEITIGLAADFAFFSGNGGTIPLCDARLITLVNLMQTDWLYPKLLTDYYWGFGPEFIAGDLAHDPFAGATTIAGLLSILAAQGPNLFVGGGGATIYTVWTNKFTRAPQYATNQKGACSFSPWTACSEFTKDNSVVRNLFSHCIGHAMGAVHDNGGPTIMTPEIVGNNIWTYRSELDIFEYSYLIRGCMNDCSGGNVPITEFVGTPTNGCVPLVVTYTNMSKNSTNYKWKFPGGSPATSTDKDPVVTYVSSGSFNVELQALNPKCSVSVEKIAYIVTRDKPIGVMFNFGAANSSNEIEFFGNADRVDTYKWKFPDGTTDEGQYVTHIFAKEGTFDVELCASNDCGEVCVKKKVSNFYVPVADFTSDTSAGCAPTTIKFFDQSSTNVINWTWSFPGGTPTGSFVKNPTIKYTRPGTYQVKLVVSSLKNSAQIIKDTFITIDSLPLAQFDPVAAGPSVSMNNSTLYAKSHFWEFGDGTTNKDSSPVHVYRDGRYEIKYTATNACGTTVTKRTITIGAKPTAGFSVPNQVGCIPFVVKFQNTSTSTATSFEWTFPGGVPSTSTDKEPVITYNTVGKFDVKLVARNVIESDSITQTQFISVQEGPTAEYQKSITGFEAFFTNLSKNANTYYWDFGDGKSSTQVSPSHNFGVEGEFLVRLITENQCGIDTFEQLIAIYLIPKVNFTSDYIKGCAPLKINFKDLSSIDVIDWSWQFESGIPAISSQKNPSISFEKAGKYTVKLSVKNTNGTNSATKLKYIEVLSPLRCPNRPNKKTGTDISNGGFIEEGQIFSRSRSEYEVNVFPNPSNDEIFIQAKIGTQYTLISLTGENLLHGEIKTSNDKIDVSKYSKGTYFLKIAHSDYNEVIKIMVN